MGHGSIVTDWLTREQIDGVIQQLSADDLIESGVGDPGTSGTKAVRNAFNLAAERAGIPEAAKRIRIQDFRYWSEAMGGAVNIDSPLSEGTEGLLVSADTGE